MVANRLSENESVQVALIEAGPASYPDADKPANYLALQGSPIDWQFVSVPQDKACLSLQGQVCENSQETTINDKENKIVQRSIFEESNK